MTAISNRSKIKRLGLPMGIAGAIALALVATGGSNSAVAKPSPDRTAAKAQEALNKGKVEKAIELAEAVVLAAPREAAYRTLLGNAYLRAGRFESAAQAFNDAMKLGDNSARTALSLALAQIGAGRNQEAIAILDDWRDAIPAADLGLAMALAGESGRGVAILSDALRSGDNTPKVRQNLAYAFALDGRWREARLMASQDVPADQIDDRISEWASRAKPEDTRLRVATLLSVPLRADAGQPAALALVDNPASQQLAAEAGALAPVQADAPVQTAANTELPAEGAEPEVSLAQYQPVALPVAEQAPYAAQDNSGFISQPVVQQVAAPAAPAPRARSAAAAPRGPKVRPLRQNGGRPAYGAGASHLVQLGSFLSEQGARRAWGIYSKQNPELKHYRMVITQATVRGKRYWRVAAAGLNAGGANGLCSTVKSRGGACFSYAAARPAAPGQRAKGAPMMAKAKPAPKAPVRNATGPANARRH